MGQIIIELPGKINRRYAVKDTESVGALLEDIEQIATRVKTNSLRLTAQDEADIRAVNRARKGDLIPWEEVKKSLGLD